MKQRPTAFAAGRFLFWSQAVTDSEILIVVRKLEQCEFTPSEFHHRDHLAVCVAYLYAGDLETAMDRMRSSLLRFTGHHNVKGYHETITRFWMRQVEQRLDRRLCLGEAVRRIQAELGDKGIIFRYYSKERLCSPEAKQGWIEPDHSVGSP
jgi:hypothetical protein